MTGSKLLALLAAAVLSGCQHDARPPLGPATPTGATEIGGPTLESAPPPPPGWNPKDVVPQSQQQAQDMLFGYLDRTVSELPPGTVLDATRYGTAGNNIGCEDEPANPKDAPTRFETSGDLRFAPGTDLDAMVRRVGEIWRSWGWYVYERDGFRKPNEFGYGPDGYGLHIKIAGEPGYPPTLAGSTPCFPGSIARDGVTFPIKVPAG